ncbi:hypothetical protein G7046_g8603 [Stylonectria norvegica]|nr:hypothetical protein G7046_g8603 [Stylonectria norvegica]
MKPQPGRRDATAASALKTRPFPPSSGDFPILPITLSVPLPCLVESTLNPSTFRPSVNTYHRLQSAPPSVPYEPAKSPLLLFEPHELQTTDQSRGVSPDDGCPLLPLIPSLPSSPDAILPLEAYLEREEKHEALLMKNLIDTEASSGKLRASNQSFGLQWPDSKASSANIGCEFIKAGLDKKSPISRPPALVQDKVDQSANVLCQSPKSSISSLVENGIVPAKRHCDLEDQLIDAGLEGFKLEYRRCVSEP